MTEPVIIGNSNIETFTDTVLAPYTVYVGEDNTEEDSTSVQQADGWDVRDTFSFGMEKVMKNLIIPRI